MTQIQVVQQFIDRINDHDVDGLCALMAPNHRFTDSLGQCVRGLDALRTGWAQYLAMVPDYCIVPMQFIVGDSGVAVFGTASGTFTRDGTVLPGNYWITPAAWRAVLEGDFLLEWQVYADNEAIRAIMARASAGGG